MGTWASLKALFSFQEDYSRMFMIEILVGKERGIRYLKGFFFFKIKKHIYYFICVCLYGGCVCPHVLQHTCGYLRTAVESELSASMVGS